MESVEKKPIEVNIEPKQECGFGDYVRKKRISKTENIQERLDKVSREIPWRKILEWA